MSVAIGIQHDELRLRQEFEYFRLEAALVKRMRNMLRGRNHTRAEERLLDSDDSDDDDDELDDDYDDELEQEDEKGVGRRTHAQEVAQLEQAGGQLDWDLEPPVKPTPVRPSLAERLSLVEMRKATARGEGARSSAVRLMDKANERAQRRLKRSLGHKLNKWVLELFGLFCNVDLFSNRALEGQQCAAHCNCGRANCTNQWRQVNLLNGCFRFEVPSLRRVKQSKWYEKSRSKWWPKLVLLFYCSALLHLTYYLYHQYCYDYYRFRLSRVRWLNRTHPHEALARRLEREDDLLESIRLKGAWLRSIGGTYMHLSFAVQCIVLLYLLTGLICYLSAMAYFKYRAPFNFYFIRNFLDYATEQKNIQLLVRDHARRFLNSSRNYSLALLESSKGSLPGERPVSSESRQHTSEQRRDDGASIVPSSTTRRSQTTMEAEHEFNRSQLQRLAQVEASSCKQLRRMLENNDLCPMNQTAPWVANQSGYYAYLCVFCICYACLFNIVIIFLLVKLMDKSRTTHWIDLLVTCEFFGLQTVCNISTIFYTSVNMFTCVDQVQLANRLRQLIDLTIELNSLRFYKNLHHKSRMNRLKQARHKLIMSLLHRDHRDHHHHHNHQASPWQSRAHLRRQQLHHELAVNQKQLLSFNASYEHEMNHDILLVLMHYKIFVGHMMLLKRVLRAAAFISVLILFLFPIISRLHMPYFDQQNYNQMRALIVILSCCIVLPVDINLVPACFLHKRCLDLYTQLNALLAHATEIISYPEGRDIYDRHIISTLRKELSYPERMAAQFAMTMHGLSFTYPDLIRFHFYFGFIVLSIILENQASQQELVGTLFSDPFRMF